MPLLTISLFDGAHTSRRIAHTLCDRYPDAIIAAKMHMETRLFMAERYGLPAQQGKNVYLTKDRRPIAYPSDVWDLVHNTGQLINNMIRIFGPPKVLIMSGSPCQQCTMIQFDGILGFTGKDSKRFMILPVLLYVVRTVSPATPIFFFNENASTMRDEHLQFALQTLSGTPRIPQQEQLDTRLPDIRVERACQGDWSLANRNRLYVTNTPRATCTPKAQSRGVLQPGWDVQGKVDGNTVIVHWASEAYALGQPSLIEMIKQA